MATATSFSATPALIEFSLLESWLASSSALQLPLHQIESQQQARGREVQRLLLQAHLQHRGDGDMGPALQLKLPDGEGLFSRRRLSDRSLTTVFGTVELVRMGYSDRARRASFRSTRHWRCRRDPSPTNSSALGQGRRAEPVLGIGPDHRRVDRRFRFQTQPGADSAGRGPGL